LPDIRPKLSGSYFFVFIQRSKEKKTCGEVILVTRKSFASCLEWTMTLKLVYKFIRYFTRHIVVPVEPIIRPDIRYPAFG
jgi:hypothetical protein